MFRTTSEVCTKLVRVIINIFHCFILEMLTIIRWLKRKARTSVQAKNSWFVFAEQSSENAKLCSWTKPQPTSTSRPKKQSRSWCTRDSNKQPWSRSHTDWTLCFTATRCLWWTKARLLSTTVLRDCWRTSRQNSIRL